MKNVIIIAGIVLVVAVIYLSLNGETAPTPDPEVEMTVTEETTEVDTMDTMEPEETTLQETIVDLAIATPELSTLVTAVSEAELAATLGSEGSFTVFAPVNEAFAALPAGTVETLLEPENQADLQGVLTYHVVPTEVFAEELTDGMTVETVNGATLTINVDEDGGVTINDSSTVITADIVASNGVIHLIDGVLLPPTE